MYTDYVNYLIAIKNNLMQCGVIIDKPLDIESEYFEVCEVESLISDVLYFYKIMAIGDSPIKLSNFLLPLDSLYSVRARKESYVEFIEYVLPNYKKLVGDNSSSFYMEGNYSVDQGILDSIIEDDSSDNSQCQYDENEEAVFDIKVASFDEVEEEPELINHGVFLEDISELRVNDMVAGNSINVRNVEVENGVFLEDISDNDNTVEESKWGSDEGESYDYVNELDVEQEELHWGEENDQSDSFLGAEEDKDYLDEDNVNEYIESEWGDEEESNSSNDEYSYQEESPWGDEDEVENFNLDEEETESTWGDEDEIEESSWGDEDEIEESSWGDEDEESEFTHADDEISESSWGDEDEFSFEDESDDDISGIDSNTVSSNAQQTVSSNSQQNQVKDLGTTLQNKTNSALTSIKRSIGSLLYKK